MIAFVLRHKLATPDVFGHILEMLSDSDPRSAREQLDSGYRYGGGWEPMPNFTMAGDSLMFPGDPLSHPIAELLLRDERVVLYNYSVVAIIQPDGSFEVARMD